LKRFIFLLALGAGILSGCSESQTSTTRAELAGTYDLTLVGRYLFVTSSDRNELRVLDLQASPRNFVPAPNPLEPLSIPVLERPSNLTRDVLYELSDGRITEGTGGPYIYARSFGAQEISVVGADPAVFQERHRLTTQGLVTAFAARAGDEIIRDPRNRGGSVLYYAAQAGLDAKLFRVELPKPEELAKDSVVTPQALSLNLTGMTVTALLVLPPPADQPGQERLVVATRGTMGSGGETFRVVVDNAVATREVTYDFGLPVRLLATHPQADPISDEDWKSCFFDRDVANRELENPPPALAAGQYIFGVLDESSCGGQLGCSGVLAVDAATGARATDATGLPMLPITVGGSLPTGLTLGATMDVNLPCLITTPPETDRVVPIVKRALVGIVPASNGSITLFDAVRMRPFDLDAADASSSLTLVDITGASKGLSDEQLATHVTVEVLDGVTQNDTYRLVYQLGLPDLGSVDRVERTGGTCPAGSTCFEVAAGPAARVEAGDIIVLRGDSGTCKDAEGTEVDYTITGKVPGNPTLLIATPPSALPAECQEMPRIIVRGSGAHPFVVTSDNKGYLGRLGEMETLEVPGSYYYRRTNNLVVAPKDVRITLQAIDVRVLKRGDQYVVTTLSHFRPYVFAIDTSSVVAGLAAYRLPGPVVYTRVGDVDFAYIAYPSADGILQVSLEAITENSANTTGLVPFE
jgi:hypothetical protein